MKSCVEHTRDACNAPQRGAVARQQTESTRAQQASPIIHDVDISWSWFFEASLGQKGVAQKFIGSRMASEYRIILRRLWQVLIIGGHGILDNLLCLCQNLWGAAGPLHRQVARSELVFQVLNGGVVSDCQSFEFTVLQPRDVNGAALCASSRLSLARAGFCCLKELPCHHLTLGPCAYVTRRNCSWVLQQAGTPVGTCF